MPSVREGSQVALANANWRPDKPFETPVQRTPRFKGKTSQKKAKRLAKMAEELFGQKKEKDADSKR